jgi:hypothetical protein
MRTYPGQQRATEVLGPIEISLLSPYAGKVPVKGVESQPEGHIAGLSTAEVMSGSGNLVNK